MARLLYVEIARRATRPPRIARGSLAKRAHDGHIASRRDVPSERRDGGHPMARPLPLVLALPRRALLRRDLVATLVARVVGPRRADAAFVASVFALSDDELAFARMLLGRAPRFHLFRSNQRASCGDFVAVDCSPPRVEQRRAIVIDLKLGARARIGGGGAGAQLRFAEGAVREVARVSGDLPADSRFDLVTGSRDAVLSHLLGHARPAPRTSRQEPLVSDPTPRALTKEPSFGNYPTL